MVYTWQCEKCREITSVERKVKDIDVPPDCCESCKHTALSRIMYAPTFVLKGGGWHNTEYTKYRSIK